MTSTTLDQIDGFSGSRALKEPVRLATTADIALEGLLTIDGTVAAEGDRVLVKDQATPSQNGIYIASSGVWSRAVDMDTTGKVVKGTQVWVTDGATLAGTLWIVSAANPIVIDTSSLTWQSGTIYQAAAAMAAAIIAATAKATPANADRFGYVDDATGQLRQMTWAEQIAAMLPGAAASQYVRRNAANTAYEHRSAAQVLSDIGGVAKAGDTMTGNLVISKSSPVLDMVKPASGTGAIIRGMTGANERWRLSMGNGASEAGGNAGSDLHIERFSDVGVSLGRVLEINRASGLISIPVGQIQFPATANPSTDANTLDDYEEGTWTPSITFATVGDLTVAYASRSGTYTKIGKVVVYGYQLQTSTFTHTTASGVFYVEGLPFATGGNFQGSGSLALQGYTKAGYVPLAHETGSSGQTRFYVLLAGSGVNIAEMAVADVPTGGTKRIYGSGTYIATN